MSISIKTLPAFPCTPPEKFLVMIRLLNVGVLHLCESTFSLLFREFLLTFLDWFGRSSELLLFLALVVGLVNAYLAKRAVRLNDRLILNFNRFGLSALSFVLLRGGDARFFSGSQIK